MPNPYQSPRHVPRSYPGSLVFETELEGRHVQLVASLVTGRERIFVDGKLASDRRSFRFRSRQPLEIDGQTYEVEGDLRWLLVFHLRFRRQGKLVRAIRASIWSSPTAILATTLPMVLASLATGYVAARAGRGVWALVDAAVVGACAFLVLAPVGYLFRDPRTVPVDEP